MTIHGVSAPATASPAIDRTLPGLAAAGIIGPSIFAAVAFAQGWLRSNYSLVGDPISALAVGPTGWVQNVNFLVFGALMVAFAIGLHRGVLKSRRGAVGLGLLVISGLGFVWAGVFPATGPAGAFIDRPLHVPAFISAFLGAGLGLVVMSRRMSRDAKWRSLSPYVLATGIIVLVLFVAGARLVKPMNGPFHQWWGLFQWILLAVWLPCVFALACRLLHLARVMRAGRAA